VTPLKKQVAAILLVFVCVVCADQVSKAVVRAKMSPSHYPVFRSDGPFFQFTHQHNEGLVGGMFSGNRLVARLAPVFASFVLLYLFRYLDPASKVQSVAYGLVAGGAIGNLIDRFRLGWVTDFLQFHFYFIPFEFSWKRYPAFNVADSAICVGVLLLVITWHTAKADDAADPV